MADGQWIQELAEVYNPKSVLNFLSHQKWLKKLKWPQISNKASSMILKRHMQWTVIKPNRGPKTVMLAMTVLLTLITSHLGNTWKMIRLCLRNQAELTLKTSTHQDFLWLVSWLKSDNRFCWLEAKRQSSFVPATGNSKTMLERTVSNHLKATDQTKKKSLILTHQHSSRSPRKSAVPQKTWRNHPWWTASQKPWKQVE